MIIHYINKDWNFAQLETAIDIYWELKLEKIWKTRFEKASIEKSVVKEIKEVVKEETKEDIAFDEIAAKEYLKEKGIRGYGLLKWEWLKKRAIAEWFIIK